MLCTWESKSPDYIATVLNSGLVILSFNMLCYYFSDYRLIKAFKIKVKGTREIWSSMAGSVCSTFAASAEEKCWNGTTRTM